MRENPKYLWLILVLALLLLLSAVSSPIWYDDAGHLLVAREGASQGELCFPSDLAAGKCDTHSPYITMGPAPAWTLVGWMKAFGTGMTSSRMLFVLFSLGFVGAMFELVRRHFSAAKAFWAVALFGVNIQFLTYGAEVLGEVPMLLGAWGAAGCWLEYEKKQELSWGVLTSIFLAFGLLSKAYLLLPLGIGMGVWTTGLLAKRAWKRLGSTCLWWGLGLSVAVLLQWISWGGWGSRGSYANEFLVFDVGEAMRFLVFKPLFGLGTVALGLRLYFHKEPQDRLFASLHLGWIVFFLASAGYDRFGFQLLIVPAIYLAEFIAGLWKKWKGKWGLKFALSLLMLVFFAQKSPFLIGYRLLNDDTVNSEEKMVTRFLIEESPTSVFTYDLQLIPFLPADMNWRLPEVVPSNAVGCAPLELKPGEYLVVGPYGRTEFQNCIPWEQMETLAETDGTENHYEIMRLPL